MLAVKSSLQWNNNLFICTDINQISILQQRLEFDPAGSADLAAAVLVGHPLPDPRRQLQRPTARRTIAPQVRILGHRHALSLIRMKMQITKWGSDFVRNIL